MKITNETQWSTRDIMRLVYRVAEDELNPGGLSDAKITIKNRRERSGGLEYGGGITGWCHYGTLQNPHVRMRLNVPRGVLDPVALAVVIAHELAHAKGMKHRQMNRTRYRFGTGWQERYAYAKDYSISKNAEPVPPPKEEALASKRQKAHAKAVAMVSKWETKVKRANTALKKWKQKARAAERRLSPSVQPIPPQVQPGESAQLLLSHS